MGIKLCRTQEPLQIIKAQERTKEMATTRAEVSLRRRPAKHQAWKALRAHYKEVRQVHLLFADDPKRGEQLTAEAAGLFSRLLEESRHE